MTATMTPERSDTEMADRDGFARLLHAEWTKFRTVRGWVIAMVIAAALTAAVGLYAASGPQTGHRTHRGGLLLLRTAGRAGRGRRGLAAAGHPGRRVRDPAVRPRLPAGEQRVYAAARFFPL